MALVPRYVGKDVFRASFPCSVLPRAKLSSSSSLMASQSRPSVGQVAIKGAFVQLDFAENIFEVFNDIYC